MEFNDLKTAAALIADWYAANKRDLPWRKGKDPYRIWIAEIMLQQTRIEAVIPYYERFIRELPDVCSLAEVPEDRLLKLWEGLGYYSRARNLRKAARVLTEQYGGRLPETAEELRALPGIGDYTAGSIASIAFGQPAPAVDGNVMRVMMRLSACGDDIMSQKNRKEVTRQLREVYPRGERASLLTEGLMELGERLCIPNGTPLCGSCPASDLCRAHASGTETDFPVRAEKKARRIEQKTVLLLKHGDRCALEKRPEKGLLAGLWGFPVLDGHLSGGELLDRVKDLEPSSAVRIGQARHIFTHREWEMEGWLIECGRMSSAFRWVTKNEMEIDFSIPTAFIFFKKTLQ